ncbi:hypothetical protein N2152v2_008403 [Parachlorella kessleri]
MEMVLWTAVKECKQVRDALAVVCKRWSEVIARSSLFWSTTCLSLSDIKVSLALAYPKRRQTGLRRRILQWLRERSGLVRSLHLLECCRMEADLPALLQALAAPTLRSLRLESCSGQPERILRALGPMRGLRCLEVDHARRLALGRQPGGYAVRMLSTLGCLEHLTLHVPRVEGDLGCLAMTLTGLKTLHVCTEQDYELRLDHISRLSALEEVTLTGAVLSALPPSASLLTALTALSLSETRCLDGGSGGGSEEGRQGGQRHAAPLLFWDTLCRLPALRALSSRHCDMRGSNLSQGVLTVSSLRSLELSSYLLNLPELPVGALADLTSLVFEGCHLLHFPPSWCCLPALHTLKFKSSPPDALPADVTRLTSLRTLWLEGGVARALLPCCALTGLTSLRLAHLDFLAVLPSGPYLEGLKLLDLQGNRFLALPPSLSRCSALEELDLSHNSRLQLDSVDVGEVLSRLPALRTLHLHKDSALCDMGGCPWDLRSVQALMALAAARPSLNVCLDASCQRAVTAGVQ